MSYGIARPACQNFIAMHLEEFPVSCLSLLPQFIRNALMWQLPLSDVCQLDNTNFTEGLDMVFYWKSPWEGAFFGVTNLWPDYDLLHYVEEWDSTEYAREMLYGLLTTCAIGNLCKEFVSLLPHCRHQESVSAISLLYTVREPHQDLQDPYLKFPPRYLHKSSKKEEDLVVPEVMKCFSKEGVLPKIFPQIEVYNNVEYDHAAIVWYYLPNAVYVGGKGHSTRHKVPQNNHQRGYPARGADTGQLGHTENAARRLNSSMNSSPISVLIQNFFRTSDYSKFFLPCPVLASLFHERTSTSSSQHTLLLLPITCKSYRSLKLRLSVAMFHLTVAPG